VRSFRLAVVPLLMLALTPLLPSAAGGEAAELFRAGNEHYAAGEYEEAVRHYQQLLNQGFSSDAVHYNLGNALFKLGRLGPAIVQYEKAALLAPQDADIRANLDYARSLTLDKVSGSGAQTTEFFVERLLDMTTLDQDAVSFTVVYLIAGALVAGWIVTRPGERLHRAIIWALPVAAVPLILLTGILGVKLYRAGTLVHAIVLEQTLDVMSGPGDENTRLFTLHEGLKVRVRSQQGSWMLISLESGLNGWVPVSSIGTI